MRHFLASRCKDIGSIFANPLKQRTFIQEYSEQSSPRYQNLKDFKAKGNDKKDRITSIITAVKESIEKVSAEDRTEKEKAFLKHFDTSSPADAPEKKLALLDLQNEDSTLTKPERKMIKLLLSKETKKGANNVANQIDYYKEAAKKIGKKIAKNIFEGLTYGPAKQLNSSLENLRASMKPGGKTAVLDLLKEKGAEG